MAPELVSHFQSDFDSGTAVVGVKNSPALPGHGREHSLGEFNCPGMGHAREVDVVDLCGGLCEGSHQRWMPMAMENGPPRGDSINDFAAIRERQELVASADDRQWRFHLAKRGVRMPDDVAVAVNQARTDV